MKKTFVTLLAMTGVAFGETITFQPLTTAGEAYGTWNATGGTVNKTDNTYTPSYGWSGYVSTYTLNESLLLSQPEDTLEFSYSFTNSSSGNCVLTMSLVGATHVITTGKGVYNYAQGAQAGYGEHNGASGFTFASGNNKEFLVVAGSQNITGAAPKSSTVTLSGTIKWNESADLFQLEFESDASGATPASVTINLGKTVDVAKIVLTADGDSDNQGSLGAMTISATIVPEPATATLSLLALCGLAARRRRR